MLTPFDSIKLTHENEHLVNDLKNEFKMIYHTLLKIDSNRERALAISNLEQASMWATKAICKAQIDKTT